MDSCSRVKLYSSSPESSWAFLGLPPAAVLRCDSRTLVTTLDPNGERRWDDPLAALHWMEEHIRTATQGTRWVGYLSYDLGRLFERVPSAARDDLGLPVFLFTLHMPGEASGPPRAPSAACATPLRSTFTRCGYESAVSRALEYIAAGDVFQVNLSQRFSVPLADRPDVVAERLFQASPARYGAYLRYGDHALISSSPELFLRVTPQPDGSRKVLTRPIKGTRPRRPGMDVELRESVKDQAELNMIVDLERNDLGRVCEIGSVKVTEPRVIEAHPTVYHGVASIEGVLRPEVTFVDLLRATFPGGSVTGAPKIRAMEIIDELEPVRRGPYCGAIGYLAADGTIELNVAIRTIIIKDGVAHVPVGGGIVADSQPGAEYEETLVKARAMFEALGVSIGDLQRD